MALRPSFPKSLDTLTARPTGRWQVAAATGGKFQIQVFAAGRDRPGPVVLDAVKDATVECGHTCSLLRGQGPRRFAPSRPHPFGPNSRQQTAWMMEGGGRELFREFFKDYNIHRHPCGNTGAQMGGLVPQGDQDRRRPQGPLPRRRLHWPGPRQSSAWCPADPRRRHLPGLERAPSTPPNGLALRRPEARLQQGRQVLLLPGLLGRRPADLDDECQHLQQRPAQGVPDHPEDACLYAHAEMQARYDVKNPRLKQLVAAGAQLRPSPTR